MPVSHIRSFIDGEFVEPSNNAWIDNYEPATGKVYSRVANSSREDVDAAVEAARRAVSEWSQSSIEQRSTWLKRLAAGIEHHLEKFAVIESKDSGKPIALARQIEIPRALLNLRFFASMIVGASSSLHDGSHGLNFTLTQPWGVGGTISPWNLPLYLLTWKVAPALAAGNCVIAKPSELTPATAYLLAEVCQEIGFPKGVLNIVHGEGALTGQAMVEHPEIPAISFTGGTVTGRKIASTAAPMFKKYSLELGGKNPNIIFHDCDYEQMLATTVRSSFQNSGQICLCGSRILIDHRIYDQFVEDFVKKTKALIVGDPSDEATQMGAVISESHQQKILGAIRRAGEQGGEVLCGGSAMSLPGRCAAGWYVAPTVIANADSECDINRDEVFGPVVTIQPFSGIDEAIRMANDTRYGLSATIWTERLDTALETARRVEAGVIWINGWLIRDLRTPFGGMKDSGVGREGGWDALGFWTRSKNVCICE